MSKAKQKEVANCVCSVYRQSPERSNMVSANQAGYSNPSSISTDIALDHERAILTNQFNLAQIIENAIRDFFNCPQNSQMIAEYMAQIGNPKKTLRRDISNNEILRPRDLPQVTGISKTNIWRLEKAGLFVEKLKLSNGCVGYFRTDVETWLANKQNNEGGK